MSNSLPEAPRPEEPERDAFEKWCRDEWLGGGEMFKNKVLLRSPSGKSYVNAGTQWAWHAYRAALASQPAGEPTWISSDTILHRFEAIVEMARQRAVSVADEVNLNLLADDVRPSLASWAAGRPVAQNWRSGPLESSGDGGLLHLPLRRYPDFMTVGFCDDFGNIVDMCGDDTGWPACDVEKWISLTDLSPQPATPDVEALAEMMADFNPACETIPELAERICNWIAEGK